MNFLPDAATLATYTLAAIVLILTPGPDLTLFVGRALAAGRAAGLASVAGVLVGLTLHSALAALGLSALLAAAPAAYDVAKLAGALYLLWLAWRAIRHGSVPQIAATGERVGIARAFLAGLAINILNPKIVLFFVTFLPQFVDRADPDAAAKLAFLGLWYVALSLPICAAMVVAADRLARVIGRSPRFLRAFDWLTAGLFGAFALRLVLSRAP